MMVIFQVLLRTHYSRNSAVSEWSELKILDKYERKKMFLLTQE